MKQSPSKFLRITKKEHFGVNPDNFQAVQVVMEWNDSERPKFVHDLLAATNSFKALIELNQSATKAPSEREKKKFSQLMAHADRLEDIIQFLSELLEKERSS